MYYQTPWASLGLQQDLGFALVDDALESLFPATERQTIRDEWSQVKDSITEQTQRGVPSLP
jgi:hypothetical protein